MEIDDYFQINSLFSNRQKLLFKIIKINDDNTFDIQFEIDNLILENITKTKIIIGFCTHPGNYKIFKNLKIFYHDIKIKALLFNKRSDFSTAYSSLYKLASKHKWLDEISSHMKIYKRHWTINEIFEIALNHEFRNDFKLNNSDAYYYALRSGWLDTVCNHMNFNKINQLDFERYVYAWVFPNNSIYIGITKNGKERESQRRSIAKDSVTKYIKETNLIPEYIKLTDFMDSLLAIEKEKQFIIEYRDKGYNIINKNSGGSIGGSFKK